MESTVCPANCTSEAGSASSQHQMTESCANTQTPVLNVCKKRKRSARQAGGGSPLTLRPNFKSEKGSVTAAAAACSPRRGIAAGRRRPYAPISTVKRVVLRRASRLSPLRGSFVDRKIMLYLRVMHLPYSTSETRTLFFFCFFFSFQ